MTTKLDYSVSTVSHAEKKLGAMFSKLLQYKSENPPVEDYDYLPEVFTRDLYEQKCDLIYQHVYEAYFGEGRSIYTMTIQKCEA